MAQRSTASTAIVVISLQLAAVGIFTLLAGASEEAGNVMLILMLGFWLLFMITESSVIGNVGKALNDLISNPSNA